MDFNKALEEQNSYYQEMKKKLSEEDIKFLLGKDYFYGVIHDMFSKKYHKRKKLINDGKIIWGTFFKSVDTYVDDKHDVIGYMVYSLSSDYQNNPEKFDYIIDRLNNLASLPKVEKQYKKLYYHLNHIDYEPVNFVLPQEISGDYIFYLTTFVIRRTHFVDGIINKRYIPFIFNNDISDELIVVPEKYFSPTFLEYYKS